MTVQLQCAYELLQSYINIFLKVEANIKWY